MVIAGIVQARFFHLPDGLADKTWLETRVELGIRQVHIPLVQDRFRFKRGMLVEQSSNALNRPADCFGVAAIDMPGNEMEGDPVSLAKTKQRRQQRRARARQRGSANPGP